MKIIQPYFFHTCVNVIGPGMTNSYFTFGSTLEGDVIGPVYELDGMVLTPLHGGSLNGRVIVAGLALCPGTVITTNIVQNSGLPGQGEYLNVLSPVPSWDAEFAFASISDLTGSSYTIQFTVDGIYYSDQDLTFYCSV